MTPVQHLKEIFQFWTTFGTEKYLKGQQEHGGRLRDKRGMLAHCEEETWDLCAYLPTLRAQLNEVRSLIYCESYETALRNLDQILGPPVNKHLGDE